uniref:Putative glycosyl transferases group 1 n=1 Tax=uncultured marine microorganism HF4000_APKG3D20 TaxID=455549 RepID=B3T7A3_9ZZZZ|nr:putative glycosyl transferases group 1 [uncultured marine microorganism HF4000_APKG3D20]
MSSLIAEHGGAMLHLDVTQSCRSANSSGVQVVTRSLYRALAVRTAVEPLAWDSLLQCYVHLSASEIDRLETPFPKKYRPAIRPNKQDNPPWKTFARSMLRLSRRMRWQDFRQPGTIMFFPEVFRDARVQLLPRKLASCVATAAIFHDACVLKFPEHTPAMRSRNFLEYATYAASRDLVVCISRETKKDLEQFILPKVDSPGRIKVDAWPVERPLCMPEIPSPRDEGPLLLCVSTLGYQKNHLGLLEAAESLWKDGIHFRLELIGQADQTWSEGVILRVDQLRASGRNLRWLRHVDNTTLVERYGQATFTVYPSRHEGFGLPILESLAHGKPCICGSNGAIGEASSDGGCLQVDQNDPDALARGIRRLLEDKTLVKQLRAEALDRNLGSWDDYAKRFLECLDNIPASPN